MKIRIISLLLAAALAVSLAGCAGNQKTSAETKKQVLAAGTAAAQAAEKQETGAQTAPSGQASWTLAPGTSPVYGKTNEPAGTTAPPAENGTPLFELHTDDFSLVVRGMSEETGHPFFGDYYALQYVFENKTVRKVYMNWDLISVCGWVLPQAIYAPVEPGETEDSSLCIAKVFLENYGVKSPDEVRFRLTVKDYEDEDAEPVYDQYVAVYPTGKTAEEIVPAVHPLAEEGVVIAETDDFRFILVPKQMEDGISTHFLVLLANKTDHELRFRWSEVGANGYSVAEYVPEDEYYINGAILPPHSQQVEYLEVVIGALRRFGSGRVESLSFHLDVFDHPFTGEETKLYSINPILFPTGKASEDVRIPAVPERPEKKVLFENEDVTLIVLEEFDAGCNTRYLTVYAENRSEKDVIVSLHGITVNGAENRMDKTFLLLAENRTLGLFLVDPAIPQEDADGSPEEIRFLMDIRREDGTVLVQDAECLIQFSEVFQAEWLTEEECTDYDSAP